MPDNQLSSPPILISCKICSKVTSVKTWYDLPQDWKTESISDPPYIIRFCSLSCWERWQEQKSPLLKPPLSNTDFEPGQILGTARYVYRGEMQPRRLEIDE